MTTQSELPQAAQAPSEITVPADARAAVLVGRQQTRLGVITAGADDMLHWSVFRETDRDGFANFIMHMQRGTPQDALHFVEALPNRLRWMTWAEPVTPGATVSSAAPPVTPSA